MNEQFNPQRIKIFDLCDSVRLKISERRGRVIARAIPYEGHPESVTYRIEFPNGEQMDVKASQLYCGELTATDALFGETRRQVDCAGCGETLIADEYLRCPTCGLEVV